MPVELIPKEGRNHAIDPSDRVVLTCVSHDGKNVASCEIYLFGATMISWKVNETEYLWRSELSKMDGLAPVTGNFTHIYICICLYILASICL